MEMAVVDGAGIGTLIGQVLLPLDRGAERSVSHIMENCKAVGRLYRDIRKTLIWSWTDR